MTASPLESLTPVRVQLRRTKGWRKPEGAIIVDRRTVYGNPFTGNGGRALAVERFREWITDPRLIVVRGPDGYDWYNHGVMGPHIPNLRGHDLACWCPLSNPCHADVLLEIANAPCGAPITQASDILRSETRL